MIDAMKLNDAIELVLFENKLIGVRCKLCGELLTYSAMNVADDPYGVKEHYKELHQEMDIELMMLNASFNRMVEYGFKRELREMRKRTGYEGLIIVSSSFGEDSWCRDMLDRHMEQLCKDGEVYLDGKRYFERMCNGSFDEIDNKLFSDMKDKEKISDNPYEGGTLYSVLRDRILEKKKLLTNATIPNDEMVRELLHTPMEELVQMLVQHELEKANAKFPQFASDMEGWSVLKEEIEEAKDELDGIICCHDNLWDGIRNGYHPSRPVSVIIANMKRCSINLIEEAIQVAAMAAKYDAMLDRNEKKEE